MTIKASCPHCEREYTLADTQEGKTVRCKDCDEKFVVEKPRRKRRDDDEEEDDRPRKRSARVRDDEDEERDTKRRRRRDDDDDDEDEDERDERPRRKAKKGGIPLWVWLASGGGGLLLIVVILVVVLFSKGIIGNKVTAENIKKIKNGMTEAEVIDILGSPTKSADASNPLLGGKSNMKVLTWEKGRNGVVVQIIDGKVAGIMAVYDDPQGAPGGGSRLR
jgi:DNA-directed RNA polymerase subunit RPC12/RpoP